MDNSELLINRKADGILKELSYIAVVNLIGRVFTRGVVGGTLPWGRSIRSVECDVEHPRLIDSVYREVVSPSARADDQNSD